MKTERENCYRVDQMGRRGASCKFNQRAPAAPDFAIQMVEGWVNNNSDVLSTVTLSLEDRQSLQFSAVGHSKQIAQMTREEGQEFLNKLTAVNQSKDNATVELRQLMFQRYGAAFPVADMNEWLARLRD